MGELGFGGYLGAAGAIASIVALFWVLRKRKPDTHNTATGSRGVEQSGGPGKTVNEATDSSDVKQTGK